MRYIKTKLNLKDWQKMLQTITGIDIIILNPTIGLLLVKGKNQTVVEYSLSGYKNPIGVAEQKNQMVKSLPQELQSSLPSIEEIEKELE